jgi:hypothetical protein
MTILGKFFTVLVFVMSAVFMAFSVMVFVTHKNWRDYATSSDPNKLGLEQQVVQQKNLNEDLQRTLQTMKNELAAEQAARRNAIAAMQTKLTQYERDLKESEGKLTALVATHGTATAQLETNVAHLTALTTQVANMRAEIRTVQQDIDEKVLTAVALTDELNQASGVKVRLEERGKQLSGQLTQLTHLLKVNGIPFDYPPKNTPPRLTGQVVAVNRGDLVEISIGGDDGIKENHELDVYRNNEYVGRIVIRKTEPDRAVGQIIPKYMKDRIRQGDNVTTKFG